MDKKEALINPQSCFNRALDNEMIFVLLGRDVAAPAAIRAWCAERIRIGKNMESDPQIVEAKFAAACMEYDRYAKEFRK